MEYVLQNLTRNQDRFNLDFAKELDAIRVELVIELYSTIHKWLGCSKRELTYSTCSCGRGILAGFRPWRSGPWLSGPMAMRWLRHLGKGEEDGLAGRPTKVT
jgi:hypothetical protein